jgi:hypothetical protein
MLRCQDNGPQESVLESIQPLRADPIDNAVVHYLDSREICGLKCNQIDN